MDECEYDDNDNNFHAQDAATTALQALSDHDLRVPYYCEENVWRLTYRRVRHQPQDRFFVVFISNSIKNVPMFQQRASDDPNQACCWDYHVILLGVRGDDVLVHDIDSLLPYPCPLPVYLRESFPYSWPLPYAPMFRVVPADVFLRAFKSDRMHMFNAQTQQWNAPPPSYPCINMSSSSSCNSDSSNLKGYLNFSAAANSKQQQLTAQPSTGIYGTILSLQELQNYQGFSDDGHDPHI